MERVNVEDLFIGVALGKEADARVKKIHVYEHYKNFCIANDFTPKNKSVLYKYIKNFTTIGEVEYCGYDSYKDIILMDIDEIDLADILEMVEWTKENLDKTQINLDLLNRLNKMLKFEDNPNRQLQIVREIRLTLNEL